MHPYLTCYKTLFPRRYRSYLSRAAGDTDMCHECLLHGTFYEEYRLYGFATKSDAQRREYLTDAERDRLCRRINSRKGSRIVSDKWMTYSLLRDHYRRQAWLLDHEDSAVRIANESLCHNELVAKPVSDCGGRGVQLLRRAEGQAWTSILATLATDGRRWIVEERIVQDGWLAQWNPDSVNTIRMNTLLRAGEVTLFAPFIRTGRRGSFVDNGAQGGLFASIDADSGIIVTDACDESGGRNSVHPDSGVPYKGQQIPRWEELKTAAIAMARRLPGMTYIGWDLALTAAGWVCVEANKGEFVAQQLTLGRGLRSEFMTLAGLAK